MMLFTDIVGQEEIKSLLIRSVQTCRIAHAQLFIGAGGTGTLPMAVAFATYISCLDRRDHDACGQCSSCQKYAKLIHPDLHFAFPVNSGKVSERDLISRNFLTWWRELYLENPYFSIHQWYEAIGIENKQGFIGAEESDDILRNLSFKPFESDYKILIMWWPELMNGSAANKLLKIIEEPPPGTFFILVAESATDLLPTILSRVQMLKFPLLNEAEIQASLTQRKSVEPTQASSIARMANGNYQHALEMLNQEDGQAWLLDSFVEMMRCAYKHDFPRLFAFIDSIALLGREKQKRFLDYSLRMVRENMALALGSRQIVSMGNLEAEFSERFHQVLRNINIHLFYQHLNDAIYHIESNGNGRIIFTDLVFQLYKLFKG